MIKNTLINRHKVEEKNASFLGLSDELIQPENIGVNLYKIICITRTQ